MSGCGHNGFQTPADWWHDLEGGEVAATRPPPPGADLPYPKLGTIPPKPVLPTRSFRDTVETQLAQQRDDTQRQAARHPIEMPDVPPPPPVAGQPGVGQPGAAGAAGADAASSTTANATLPGADAPPAKPAAAPAAPAPGVAPGLAVAGAPADAPGLVVPDAPPAPASFEGVPALPAPTPLPPVPPHALPAPGTGQVLFATGSAELDSSQTETLKGPMAKRGNGSIAIEGHGDAASDSPSGQEAALRLGLQRAQAIAAKYEKMGVPGDALVLSATAFGRGASVWANVAEPALPKASKAGPKDESGHRRTVPAGIL
jgi:outer membrane protein OmpA-like peptidoglycan-associated protein